LKMRALVKETPEKGASIRETRVPEIGDNEILVKVKRSAICGTDIHIFQWSPFAQQRIGLPMIFGHEACGEVVKVGNNVVSFREGDLIAVETHIPCGTCFQCRTGLMHICREMKIIGVHTNGTFAEFVAIPEICAWKLSQEVSPSVGAVFEPFGIGVHALAKHKVAGKRVLITGAGPIGLFTAGLARYSGAMKVISADISEERLGIALKMGADVTINPNKVNMVEEIKSITGGFGVDILVELSGNSHAAQQGFNVLRRGGSASLVGLFNEPVPLDLVNDVIYKEAVVFGITGRLMFSTWAEASDIISSGKMDISPVITHYFRLEDFEDAFELGASGKAGKIIFEIS
jgi:threonine 3-dehydrogenase